jgi:quercetin dioxygenase-like cupin family protein
MIRAGDSISNPISGETIVFLTTGLERPGAILRAECIVKPGGRLAAPLMHVHPIQTETFWVLEGELQTVVNGVERVLRAGETIAIEPGVPHLWGNASKTKQLRFTFELSPGLEWATLFESIFAMARDGLTKPNGTPPILAMAAGLHQFKDHFYLDKPSIKMQKTMFALLAPIAKLAGYRQAYPYKREARVSTAQRS